MVTPAAGPARWQSTTIAGSSAMLESPSISVISDRPGPLVAVIDFTLV